MPSIRFLCVALAVAGLYPAACALAGPWQPLEPSLPFEFYGPADGMTQAAVKHMTQDEAGRLWLATQRGVNRFDGAQFQAYTMEDGLPNNAVARVFAFGRDVWVGDYYGNVSVIHAGKVQPRRRSASRTRAHVLGFAAYDSTMLVSIGGVGVVALDPSGDNGGRTVFSASEWVQDLRVVNGVVWFLQQGVLKRQRLNQEPWSPEPVASDIAAYTFSADGRHWLLDTNNRVGVLADGQFRAEHRFESGSRLKEIVVDGSYTIWARGERAIYGIEQSRGNPDRTRNRSLSFEQFGLVDDIFTDREGTLWVGAERTARYLGSRFEHFQPEKLGYNSMVWAIEPRLEGGAYVAADDRVLEYADRRVRELNDIVGLPLGGTIDALRTSGDGRLLYTSRGEHGVYRIDLDQLSSTRLEDSEGLKLRSMAVDTADRLWVAAVEGIYVSDGQRLEQFDTNEDHSFYAIAAGDDGSVWYAIDGAGLVRVDTLNNMQRTLYGPEAGFEARDYNHILWLAPDNIWASAENGHLYQFDGVSARDIGPQTPIRFDSAFFAQPGADNTVLVGSSDGLYQIDPVSGDSVLYSYAHGFLGIETNAGASAVDASGTVWIGTVNGFASMDQYYPMTSVPAPKPQILSVSSADGRTNGRGELELPWHFKSLGFEFAAVSLLYPQNTQYSYRIVGRDDAWSAASANHQVDVSGLPAGRYSLEVRARLNGQSWSRPVQSETIVVLAPFWREPWFVVFACALAGGLTFLLVRLRTRRIEAANKRLRFEVRERTRSIEQAKEHLEEVNRHLSAEIDQRQEADRARRDVEERFKRAFEYSPIGMALLTTDRQMVDANRALRRMLWPEDAGNEDGDAVLSLFGCVVAQYREQLDGLIHAMETGKHQRGEIELQLTDATGVTLDAVMHLSAIRQSGGEYSYAVCQVQDVTDARRMTQQLAYQANYDELTGLLNRRAFEKAITAAHAEAGQYAELSYLVYMDLDQFKIVNDTSGHAAGDELLRQVSQLLQSQVRSDDLLSRLGGDEFALLLWQCPRGVAQRIADQIRASIEDFQFNWESETYRIGVSIGVVALEPGGAGLEELQQMADAACYEAKDAGRNCVRFARPSGRESSGSNRSQMRWVQRLRDAMDNSRFALYGQIIRPVSAAAGSDIERMEVLLRLRDPATRRLVPPGAFLPAAERYGLIAQLDRWVVENLIRTLFVHHEFGAEQRKYWVNLSGGSVSDPRFAEFLVDAVRNSPLPEGMLNFEITETAVMRSVSDAGKLMSQLRDYGCQFALDDFGSGLSSFGYLKKLPVDYLKIDGMFVRDILTDPTDRIFVRSIIDIAHTLGVSVTTEFVENDDTLALVTELGADYVQGFGIHRPEMLFPQFPARSAVHTAGAL